MICISAASSAKNPWSILEASLKHPKRLKWISWWNMQMSRLSIICWICMKYCAAAWLNHSMLMSFWIFMRWARKFDGPIRSFQFNSIQFNSIQFRREIHHQLQLNLNELRNDFLIDLNPIGPIWQRRPSTAPIWPANNQSIQFQTGD